MANVLGSLLVELGVNMSAFHEGMSKATYTAKQSAKDISNSFKEMGGALQGVLSHFGTMGTVVGQAIQSVGSDMAELSAKMGSIKGGAGIALTAVGGLAAGALAAGAALSAMALEGGEIAHTLEMMSQKTGI